MPPLLYEFIMDNSGRLDNRVVSHLVGRVINKRVCLLREDDTCADTATVASREPYLSTHYDMLS